MENQTMTSVQTGMLEILKEIHRVSKQLNTPYWLDNETLLGAVLVKGFLPEASECSVGMLRASYERFMTAAPGMLDKRFSLKNWDNCKTFGFPYGEICEKGHAYVKIFPYDTYPEEQSDMKKQKTDRNRLCRLILAKCGMKTSENQKGLSKALSAISDFLYGLKTKKFTRNQLILQYNEVAQWFNGYQTGFYYCQTGNADYEKTAVVMDIVNTHSICAFEGEKFLAPFDVDQYLTQRYGKYLISDDEEPFVDEEQ